MEGLRSEVSQKIKKAIQAKLVELGVTIDEELPDYVMVLVVNKKSKKQMEDDLSLFLQEKTATFVEWLLEILGKLQTMSMQAKEKAAKAAVKSARHDAAENEARKRSSSACHPEAKKRIRSEPAEHHTSKDASAEPKPCRETGPSADGASTVHVSAATKTPQNSDTKQTSSAALERRSSGEPRDVTRDSLQRRGFASRDLSEPRHSKSRDSPKSRRSESRDSSKSRRSESRDSSKSRRSESRDASKSRRSSSRDSSKSRRSVSRDSSKSRSSSRDPSKSRSSSRDSSKSRRSSSHDPPEPRRSESRDSSEPRPSASRDPPEPRRSPDGNSEPRSRDRDGPPPGRRHPRISFPSDGEKPDQRRASRNRETDAPTAGDGDCRRVPSPHAAVAPSGGRIINLREESSFPGGRRSRSRSPTRRGRQRQLAAKSAGSYRGPQSAVGAVLRRPPDSDSDSDSDSATEHGRRRAVASSVRVTDRPRPPADLLPRPAILVKAMRDARRSTGADSAAGGGRRESRGARQPGDAGGRGGTAASGGGKKALFVRDLRSKLGESRRPATGPPAGLTGAVRAAAGRSSRDGSPGR